MSPLTLMPLSIFKVTSSKGGASRILILLYTFIFCIQISTIVIFQVIDFIHPMQPSNMNIIYKKFWRFWDFHVLGPFNAKIVWLFGYRMFKWQKHIYYLVLCSYVKQSMWVIYKYMCNIFCQMLWIDSHVNHISHETLSTVQWSSFL